MELVKACMWGAGNVVAAARTGENTDSAEVGRGVAAPRRPIPWSRIACMMKPIAMRLQQHIDNHARACRLPISPISLPYGLVVWHLVRILFQKIKNFVKEKVVLALIPPSRPPLAVAPWTASWLGFTLRPHPTAKL